MNDMVACRGCGKEIHRTALRCPQCGAAQLRKRYKSKLAAGLLAIFIGGLGIHRFYLGQWWGLFYLLFWITGIPSLVSIVEGIVFLATSDESWDNKYNDGVAAGEGGSAALVVVIAVLAGFFIVIPVIGILAAIAIPAYHDYTVRAKVNEAIAAGMTAQAYVEEYTVEYQAWPPADAAVDLAVPINGQPVASARMLADGVVELTLLHGPAQVADKTILLEPDIAEGFFSWSCTGGTLEARYRPARCRAP
ncbi:MAG: NINE protein [Granulosicoccaceae bacterium]|jgi:TM2 domain-containing membrane protein YozV/Tfp pilus assembly major pilin PilA